MNKNIDKRFISNEFLLKYFPSPHRFKEITSNPPESTLVASEERYIEFRENLNNKRRRSGKSHLSDSDLAIIIKQGDGYIEYKPPYDKKFRRPAK